MNGQKSESLNVDLKTDINLNSKASEVTFSLWRGRGLAPVKLVYVIFNITDRSKAILLIGSLCLLALRSVFVLFSPSICLDDI